MNRGSATALADALSRLLADDELRAEFGRKGREKALAEFDWLATAQQMVGVYRSLRTAEAN